jgi:thioredoxin
MTRPPATSAGMDASLPAITSETFDRTIARPGFVVIDCSAPWCGPCRVFAPVFAAAAAARPEHTWCTLDTDAEPQLAAVLDVRAQPTVVVLRDGAVVYKHVGAIPAAKFDELIARVTR